MNWPLVAAILAVLAVPFAIAAIQDIGRDTPAGELAPAAGPAEDEGAGAGLDEHGEIGEPHEDEGHAHGDEHGWQRTEVMEQAFFDRVFLGEGHGRPTFRGALAGARFGMSRDQVRVEAAALWRWSEQNLSEFADAAVGLEFEDAGGEGLSAIAIRFPDDGSARRILAASWGPPVVAQDQDAEERHFWFDEKSGTRVRLREEPATGARGAPTHGAAEVVYDRVLPIATYYHRARGFAFEKKLPLLGATPDAIAAAYGKDFEFDPESPSAGRLAVDATDFGRARTPCTIAFQDGKAVALYVILDHGWRADFGPVAFEALRAELGPVRATESDQDGNRWTFDDGVTVQQSADAPRLIVSVSRP
jgi:hypothetical protein